MALISCPLCAGPVALCGSELSVENGAGVASAGSQEELQREALAAVLSAVLALEDWASGAKWLLKQPRPSAQLQLEARRAVHHAEVLRDLLQARRETVADAEAPDAQ